MKVAVALIIDDKERVLVTRRSFEQSHGGYWEFPGGKLELDESPEAALVREVWEETGIEVREYQFLGKINHSYPEKTVTLMVFLVTQFLGTPVCQENQLDMKWISQHEIKAEEFPEANQQIIALFCEATSSQLPFEKISS